MIIIIPYYNRKKIIPFPATATFTVVLQLVILKVHFFEFDLFVAWRSGNVFRIRSKFIAAFSACLLLVQNSFQKIADNESEKKI